MSKKNKKRANAQGDDSNRKKNSKTETNRKAESSIAANEASGSQLHHPNTPISDNVPNPLLVAQTNFLNTLSISEREGFFSNTLDPVKRAEIWTKQAELGEGLVNQFSWAIPDARALAILKHFSPLVEIGCGANAYWCQMMHHVDIDVIGFDAKPESGGMIIQRAGSKRKGRQSSKNDAVPPFSVRQGGPEALASEEIRSSNRTLFLCYSDEGEDAETSQDESPATSLGLECLEHYGGEHIIHVGELYGDSLSIEQAPWGRSSSPSFQERLATEFHCILKVGLTNWLFSRDTISVWKRSETCSIVYGADDDDDDDDSAEEEVQYKHIPVEERLPVDVAAPCVAHLLTTTIRKNEAGESTTSVLTPFTTNNTVASPTSGGESKDYVCPW